MTRFALRCSVTLGRQGSGEPQAPHYLAVDRKLIICDSDNRTVSRKQFALERVAYGKVQATNTGTGKARTLHEAELATDSSVVLPLPFSLSVSGFEFVFDIDKRR